MGQNPYVMNEILNKGIVESLLSKGAIKIASFSDILLCATFYPHFLGAPVSVRSDKGIDHLLTSLALTIRGESTEDIDKKYPYPVAFNMISELLKQMKRSLATLTYDGGDSEYVVIFEEYQVPSLTAHAGKYRKYGKGETLAEAFDEALKSVAIAI
ncbi:MAG: hypothetical protein JWL92_175 [Candidatus Nomurabacteria bacterium]|nr:hypothetical protein [Candidatus Nomurabacteria bacterium]